MSEWQRAGYTWGEAVGAIQLAVKAEEQQHGEDHGLRGVFAIQLDIAVVVGQLRGEVMRLDHDMFGGIAGVAQLSESRTPDGRALGQGLGVQWLKAVDDLLRQTTISGFAAPATMPVEYQRITVGPVTTLRFEMVPDLDFGPDGQMPVTHHLLAVALELEGYRPDRNVLRGAW